MLVRMNEMGAKALRNTTSTYAHTLHCMVHYPTECSPVSKGFHFKRLKPFELTVKCSCKTTQSLKEKQLSSKQLEIKS